MVADHIAGKPCKQLNLNRIPLLRLLQPGDRHGGSHRGAGRATGKDVGTGVFNLSGNGKALTMVRTRGFVKFVFDKATEEILGFHVIGPRATDLAAEVAAVMECEGHYQRDRQHRPSPPHRQRGCDGSRHACHGNSVHAPKARK